MYKNWQSYCNTTSEKFQKTNSKFQFNFIAEFGHLNLYSHNQLI